MDLIKIERPILDRTTPEANIAVIDKWLTDTTDKLNFLMQMLIKDQEITEEAIKAAGKEYKAGKNITIEDDVISAEAASYTAGENVSINGNVISATDTKYTPGTNVQISDDNVISATDTKATVNTSGSGNAVTAISASNGALTATKGATFLESGKSLVINAGNGSAGTQGYTALAIGNNTGAHSDGNSAGRLRIYGLTTTSKDSTGYYAQIQAGTASSSLTANRTYTIPSVGSNTEFLVKAECPTYIVESGTSGNYRYQLFSDGTVRIWGRVSSSYNLTSYRANIGAYAVANVLTNCSDIKLSAIDMANIQSDGNNTSGVLTQYYPRAITVANGNANIVGWVSNAYATAAETTARTIGINIDIWGRI